MHIWCMSLENSLIQLTPTHSNNGSEVPWRLPRPTGNSHCYKLYTIKNSIQHSHYYKSQTGIRTYVKFSRVKKRKLDYLLTSCYAKNKNRRGIWGNTAKCQNCMSCTILAAPNKQAHVSTKKKQTNKHMSQKKKKNRQTSTSPSCPNYCNY